MPYTLIDRRFPSALLKKLYALSRRNRCSVSEQARTILGRPLEDIRNQKRHARALRR